MCRLVIERSCPLACAESTRTDWASRARREEKGVELARLLEQIESPQCGDGHVAVVSRPPSGFRRSGGRSEYRTSWCGRTWCPRV